MKKNIDLEIGILMEDNAVSLLRFFKTKEKSLNGLEQNKNKKTKIKTQRGGVRPQAEEEKK
jgi:hypothetical protein